MKRHALVTTLRRGVALLCASLGACLAPCPAPAQSTANFYSGKTVTFVAPPDVPGERLDVLRQAFDRTARDPTFLAAAAKAGREISAITALEINTMLGKANAMPADIVRRAAEISSGR